jgi:hypothetical protein
MPADERDVLDVLKSELDFITKGNYSRASGTPSLPSSLFQDSPTCLNFGDTSRSHPCDECLLSALVPQNRLRETVPCHYIPLNAEGETVHYLERNASREEMEQKVAAWLGCMVEILEQARAREVVTEGQGHC